METEKTYRIVAYLKGIETPRHIQDVSNEDEGERLMENSQFALVVWNEFGAQMDYLQLEVLEPDGTWSQITSVIDPWER